MLRLARLPINALGVAIVARQVGLVVGEVVCNAGNNLGAGLLHLLPDAADGFSAQHISYPWVFFLCAITFLVLLSLEHLGREFYQARNCNNQKHKHLPSTRDGSSFAILAVIMLSFHSFFAGAALGLSVNTTSLMVLVIAILAHKWAASFALSVQICKSGLSNTAAIAWFMLFALMVPAGIFFGAESSRLFASAPLVSPSLLALAAGTFLYLGTLHGLQRSVMVEKCCNLRQFAFVIIGFAIMAVVAVWA